MPGACAPPAPALNRPSGAATTEPSMPAPAVHQSRVRAAEALISRDEPADIRHHQDELLGTAGACNQGSAQGTGSSFAHYRAMPARCSGPGEAWDHVSVGPFDQASRCDARIPGIVCCSPRVGPIRRLDWRGIHPGPFYRRRALPSTCVATGTTIGIGATHILRSCSISNPAASIAAGVSRAVWQPPNALGQNVRSTKC